jgi:Transposase, Mutator family
MAPSLCVLRCRPRLAVLPEARSVRPPSVRPTGGRDRAPSPRRWTISRQWTAPSSPRQPLPHSGVQQSGVRFSSERVTPDVSDGRWVILRALVLKVREGGRVVGVHALGATGVNNNGHREILGLHVSTNEDGAGQRCPPGCPQDELPAAPRTDGTEDQRVAATEKPPVRTKGSRNEAPRTRLGEVRESAHEARSPASAAAFIEVGAVRRHADPRPLPTDGPDRPHRRCE